MNFPRMHLEIQFGTQTQFGTKMQFRTQMQNFTIRQFRTQIQNCTQMQNCTHWQLPHKIVLQLHRIAHRVSFVSKCRIARFSSFVQFGSFARKCRIARKYSIAPKYRIARKYNFGTKTQLWIAVVQYFFELSWKTFFMTLIPMWYPLIKF